jgi:hypothetical protein
MFFPAAHFLSVEEVGVIAVIARFAAIEGGLVNLLPNPSLSRFDGRSTVDALLRAHDHFLSFLDDKTLFLSKKSRKGQ